MRLVSGQGKHFFPITSHTKDEDDVLNSSYQTSHTGAQCGTDLIQICTCTGLLLCSIGHTWYSVYASFIQVISDARLQANIWMKQTVCNLAETQNYQLNPSKHFLEYLKWWSEFILVQCFASYSQNMFDVEFGALLLDLLWPQIYSANSFSPLHCWIIIELEGDHCPSTSTQIKVSAQR